MKRTTLFLAVGTSAACASNAAFAHADVGVYLGVPGPVYVAPPPVVYEAPPRWSTRRPQSMATDTAMMARTATSADGMTMVVTVNRNTIVTKTTTDLPMVALDSE